MTAIIKYKIMNLKNKIKDKEMLKYFMKNPCSVCALTHGKYNCLKRSVCKCNDGLIYQIKNITWKHV